MLQIKLKFIRSSWLKDFYRSETKKKQWSSCKMTDRDIIIVANLKVAISEILQVKFYVIWLIGLKEHFQNSTNQKH